MTKEIIVDDNHYPSMPLFEQGQSRDDQARGLGKFAEKFKARSRDTDMETSHEAAEGITRKLPRLETLVLQAIASCGDKGMNSYEIEIATHLPNETCTPRLAPLRRKGFIADSGIKRPGKTGKNQIVWVAKKYAD